MTRSSVHPLFARLLLAFIAMVIASPVFAQKPTDEPNTLKGTLERIKVHGASLEGNLEGDSPEREVVVYLPPSYAKEKNRRYPVMYFLHGYTVGAEMYVKMLQLQNAMDGAVADGVREMIAVLPDAFTVYGGSMYSNSLTTGDWEGYISHDLISYIDSHYRTIADRSSRGLAGHSMGGYGTIRIGMKHPEVFGALYTMSSCCLMNDPTRGPGDAAASGRKDAASKMPPVRGDAPRGQPPAGRRPGGGFSNALFAQAAAWAPNPMNPPQYFDLPVKDGKVQPLIAAKWTANSPLVTVDQYVPNLKKYSAIAMDVGNADPLGGANIDLEKALTRLGVPHSFEQYQGNHTNRIAERFRSKVIPFFSEQLVFNAKAGLKARTR